MPVLRHEGRDLIGVAVAEEVPQGRRLTRCEVGPGLEGKQRGTLDTVWHAGGRAVVQVILGDRLRVRTRPSAEEGVLGCVVRASGALDLRSEDAQGRSIASVR